MAAKEVSLKLFIEKGSQQRVLYAEVEKEFVDFLFSIFTLPVGVVFRLLKEGNVTVGSLQSLYRSIENMSVTHIQPYKDKSFLLEPKVFMPGAKPPTLLLPNVGSTFHRLYKCSSSNTSSSTCLSYIADNDSTNCGSCGTRKNLLVSSIDSPSAIRAFSTSEEGYVRGTVTYMVMDDLEVKPLSSNALVTLLSQFNVDIRDLEEKVVDVGMDELFIEKGSQRRVLYAEADKEFVDFLFGIFTLPVGVVFRLLKEESVSVGSLQSLYRSIENMSVTHIQLYKDKSFLLEPKVFMPGAKPPTLLLPNVASTFRRLYKCSSLRPSAYSCCLSYVADNNNTICGSCGTRRNLLATIIDSPSAFSTSEEGYVRGTVTYMVTDDLDVKVLSTTSLVTLLSLFNVNDIREIEERVVVVGMDEGVKLLHASLQSKTVLTDVFLPAKIIRTEVSVKNEGTC
ncbi:uncharacterized protein LOC132188071 [Corylus avellana]|uniref:uncharacterized protein LOC132188071 n=1 Tax=Corylus avellana TaxID=13451 RepID=UPI00286AD84B|nr:uncharacterized protein LOC132188071 [Corylus avellana]